MAHGLAAVMYGTGLRLMECLRLRVQDLDFSRNEILVRDGKGAKDRITMLPESTKAPLQEHLKKAKAVYQQDVADGWGRVQLPHALDRKYPNAPKDWRWQWVFPQQGASSGTPLKIAASLKRNVSHKRSHHGIVCTQLRKSSKYR